MTALGDLRAIRDCELELMLSWRNAPSVRANMYTRHEISLAEHLSWWERTARREDQEYFMYEKDGAGMGIVAFTEIDRANANCCWAFYAAPDAARGTGSRMEYLALQRVFGALGLHKLYCEVLAFNAPVIALHQKFGFQIEGRFRDQHKVDGEYIDIVRLGLLAEEWASKHDEMLGKLTGSHQKAVK